METKEEIRWRALRPALYVFVEVWVFCIWIQHFFGGYALFQEHELSLSAYSKILPQTIIVPSVTYIIAVLAPIIVFACRYVWLSYKIYGIEHAGFKVVEIGLYFGIIFGIPTIFTNLFTVTKVPLVHTYVLIGLGIGFVFSFVLDEFVGISVGTVIGVLHYLVWAMIYGGSVAYLLWTPCVLLVLLLANIVVCSLVPMVIALLEALLRIRICRER